MVSRQEGTFYPRKRDFTIYEEEFHNSFKKSKQEDPSQGKIQSIMFNQRPKSKSMRSITFDFELHLNSSLPSDWQKSKEAKVCLFDICVVNMHLKHGCQYFQGYSRASEDYRTYPKDPVIVGRPKMSLDLELNLSPSYSPSETTMEIDESSNHNETVSSPKRKNLRSPSKKTKITE
ncbi:hypothetical protein Bca52824_007151 [Brassica carinata]|uniref:Uncharacterized protein n=1 Tax=Brassica carinata TaxID=52824 RepID=A0A8X7W5R7_BRACI|nr:hypothetical protein Bca52824_007151 [Brassica carinata]